MGDVEQHPRLWALRPTLCPLRACEGGRVCSGRGALQNHVWELWCRPTLRRAWRDIKRLANGCAFTGPELPWNVEGMLSGPVFNDSLL